jgi:hypothetical protein
MSKQTQNLSWKESFMGKSWAVVVLFICGVMTSAQQLGQKVTNQDVIDMVGMGLSDELIIDKIHSADATKFDTSVPALRVLKAAKVSDSVIRTMFNPHAAGTTRSDAPANRTERSGKDQMPDEVGVYFLRRGELLQLDPELVGWQTGGVMKRYATLGIDHGHINGKVMKPHSPVRLSCPVDFLIKTPEGTSVTEYQLLQLYEKGNRREFRALTGGVYHASGGAERTTIPFTPEKIGTRVWRIRVNGLKTGEYGFLPPGVAASSIAASGKIYAFGITGESSEQDTTTVDNSSYTTRSRNLNPQQSVSVIAPLGITVRLWRDGGAEILDIEQGGAAQQGGLKAGYVINGVEGKTITTPADLEAEIGNRPPGTEIHVAYMFHTSLGFMENEKKITLGRITE